LKAAEGSPSICPSGGNRALRLDAAAAVFHAVAYGFLVNVELNTIHTLHEELVESESAGSLSSAFLHQELLHDLFIQTYQELAGERFKEPPKRYQAGALRLR
jgi:hypothetical protein